MSKHLLRHALPITAVLLFGCGDDGDDTASVDSGPTPLSVEDLNGTWHASTHRFTNQANQAEQYETIANGGETRMTVLTGGRARTWITIGDFSDEFDAQLVISGTRLTSTPAESTRPTVTWELTLDGDELTLLNEDSEFDFTMSDATPVAATVYLEMTRE